MANPLNEDSASRMEIESLARWRDDAVRAGNVPDGALKDTDLLRIVNFGRKDVREVSKILSRGLRPWAPEIVERLMSVSGQRASPGPPTAPVSTGPSSPASSSPASSSPAPHTSAPGSRSPGQDQPSPSLAGEVSRFVPTKRIAELPTTVPLRLIELTHGLRLRWSADPLGAEASTAYRVVSNDDRPPYSPDSGQLVDVTTELSCVDLRPPAGARRFYVVYRYCGPTVEEMFESQPTRLAQGNHVFGVQDATLEEDEGRVIGRWRVLPGVERVLVFRVPVDELHLSAPADERHRIAAEDANLAGFVDKSADRGRSFRYDFYVEARVGEETRRSEVVSVEHSVTASLTRVTDLEVARHFDEHGIASFDLSWTKPAAGEVTIYRSESGPLPGATNDVHPVEALPQTKLDLDDRLRLPVVPLGEGREGVRDVPGRASWSRVHFTPVTVLDQEARVGDTVTQLVVGELVQPEIVERCDHQIVKFGWPPGAAKVVALMRGGNERVGPPRPGERYEEIDFDTYRRLGRLELRQSLDPRGSAIHLMGQAFEGGRSDFGPPAVISYPGLLRLRYTVETRQRRFRLDRIVIRIEADREVSPAPSFVLVHQPDRLPLHPHDGTPLEVSLDLDTVTTPSRLLRPDRLGRTPTAVGWSAGVRGLTGYVRLFVDQSQGRFALLDPAPATLVLRP